MTQNPGSFGKAIWATIVATTSIVSSPHGVAAMQEAPRSGPGDPVHMGDESRTCADIDAEVQSLLVQLGQQSEQLNATLADVQSLNARGSEIVNDAVKRTKQSQAITAASELANVVPGGGIVSSLIGTGVSAATGVDRQKLTKDQQAASRAMAAAMAQLEQRANAVMPDAMRLQHLNTLQSRKGCG